MLIKLCFYHTHTHTHQLLTFTQITITFERHLPCTHFPFYRAKNKTPSLLSFITGGVFKVNDFNAQLLFTMDVHDGCWWRFRRVNQKLLYAYFRTVFNVIIRACSDRIFVYFCNISNNTIWKSWRCSLAFHIHCVFDINIYSARRTVTF